MTSPLEKDVILILTTLSCEQYGLGPDVKARDAAWRGSLLTTGSGNSLEQ